jgi:hypothetical protein
LNPTDLAIANALTGTLSRLFPNPGDSADRDLLGNLIMALRRPSHGKPLQRKALDVHLKGIGAEVDESTLSRLPNRPRFLEAARRAPAVISTLSGPRPRTSSRLLVAHSGGKAGDTDTPESEWAKGWGERRSQIVGIARDEGVVRPIPLALRAFREGYASEDPEGLVPATALEAVKECLDDVTAAQRKAYGGLPLAQHLALPLLVPPIPCGFTMHKRGDIREKATLKPGLHKPFVHWAAAETANAGRGIALCAVDALGPDWELDDLDDLYLPELGMDGRRAYRYADRMPRHRWASSLGRGEIHGVEVEVFAVGTPTELWLAVGGDRTRTTAALDHSIGEDLGLVAFARHFPFLRIQSTSLGTRVLLRCLALAAYALPSFACDGCAGRKRSATR